jgi:hypothetical protein
MRLKLKDELLPYELVWKDHYSPELTYNSFIASIGLSFIRILVRLQQRTGRNFPKNITFTIF